MRTRLALAFLLLAGCDAGNAAAGPDSGGGGGGNGGGDGAFGLDLGGGDLSYQSLIAARPYMWKIPQTYDPSRPWPLLVLLHGYTVDGVVQDYYFGLGELVDSKGFLYAYPDGTVDRTGQRFWNATNACCDLYGTGVDDVAYVTAVIDDMSRKFNVDPKRIFLAGHSNGAFMSHRMACDRASRIAAIMALAGDDWKDTTKCQPSEPVSVLQVHGDLDAVVLYNGGSILGNAAFDYPSAPDSVGGWVQKNGCDAAAQAGAPLDLEAVLPGAETTVQKWSGCKPGGAAELWTIHGGTHVPVLQSSWAETIWGWLAAHPKP